MPRLAVVRGLRSSGRRFAAHEVRDHVASIAFISSRGTMRSTIPCSSKNSERWNPSGSFSPNRRGDDARAREANQGPGSATLTSPSRAQLAATPPVVGSRSTLMNGGFCCSVLGQHPGRGLVEACAAEGR